MVGEGASGGGEMSTRRWRGPKHQGKVQCWLVGWSKEGSDWGKAEVRVPTDGGPGIERS